MTYLSVVTSKGTITIPSDIRKKLGITAGRKVTLRLRGDAIEVIPQSGWDEFFTATKKIKQGVRSGKKHAKPLLTNDEIAVAARKAREDGNY